MMVRTMGEDLGLGREVTGHDRLRDAHITETIEAAAEAWTLMQPASRGPLGVYVFGKLKEAGFEIRIRPGSLLDDSQE